MLILFAGKYRSVSIEPSLFRIKGIFDDSETPVKLIFNPGF